MSAIAIINQRLINSKLKQQGYTPRQRGSDQIPTKRESWEKKQENHESDETKVTRYADKGAMYQTARDEP